MGFKALSVFICSLLITLGPISSSVLACTQDGEKGFMEENNLYIPANSLVQTGISEAEFNEVIDKVQEIYTPIVESFGAKLEIVRSWEDGTVNAYAQQVGQRWIVKMFGGLARHELVTKDGFALVLCHELGHHLAGAPKKRYWGTWASNEGQSDYWGNLKCLRKVMEKDDNIIIAKNLNLPKIAKSACSSSFADKDELATCHRRVMAGKSLANLLAYLGKSSEPQFETPDSKVVSRTNDSHPKAQCRLDTYFQGALCSEDPYIDVENRDPNTGTCNRSKGDQVGIRPLCWFRPS